MKVRILTCVYVSTGLASLLDPAEARGKMVSGEAQRMRQRSFINRFKNVVAQLVGNFVFFSTTEKKGTITILKNGNLQQRQERILEGVYQPSNKLRSKVHSQHTKCVWNRYNIAWPFRGELSSGRTVPTSAACCVRVLRYQENWLL
jgi:hypothetical protein